VEIAELKRRRKRAILVLLIGPPTLFIAMFIHPGLGMVAFWVWFLSAVGFVVPLTWAACPRCGEYFFLTITRAEYSQRSLRLFRSKFSQRCLHCGASDRVEDEQLKF